VLSSSAVNLANSDVTGILPLANGGTNANLTAVSGGIVYSNGSALAISGVGTTGQCLGSNGSSTPSWINCASGINPWTVLNGAIVEQNNTEDLLLGSTASSSAKFGVLGINTNTTTATISGSTGSLVLNNTGTIQTTANQNLVLGSNTTGNIILNPLASVTVNGAETVNGNLTATGTIDFSNLGIGVVHAGSGGVLSSSAVNLANSDVTGILPLANGGTNANLTAVSGGIVYSGGSALAISAAGTQNQILISNGAGTPTFASSINVNNVLLPVTGGTDGFWQLTSNVIAPSNLASDLAIGGNSTASATFQIFSNGNATTSGSFTFNTAGLLQTTNKQNLTLGSNTTGNIILNPLASVTVNGAETVNGNLTATGTIDFSNLGIGVVHAGSGGVLSSSAVNLANSDVTGVLPLANGGTNANLTAVSGGIVYSGNSALAISTVGSNGYCLVSNGASAPIWAQCATGPQAGINYWTLQNGALNTINNTADLLVGGTSSTSAKFAVLGVNTTTTTASISGQIGSLTLTNNGIIQTTNNQNLTLGSGTTGNITLSPLNSVSVTGGLNVTGTIDFSNLGIGVVHAGSGGVLSSSAVNLANSDVTGVLPLANGGTNANLTANAGGIVFSNSTGFAIVTPGTTGQCLASNGSNTPSWVTCAGGTNLFTLNANAITPINSTYDFLIGGNSTASAKFGFLNNAGGTPIASISAGVSGATTIDATGNIQTTANQNLTLGGGATGNIVLSPLTSVTINGAEKINGNLTATGTIDFSNLGIGVVHAGSGGVLSSSAVNLAN
ncbi:MAG: hypothetical protein KGL95_09890, partial [Patescibacteria group bacterium]|nr:hypothetical protein [Patescibacteria group bacterium]